MKLQQQCAEEVAIQSNISTLDTFRRLYTARRAYSTPQIPQLVAISPSQKYRPSITLSVSSSRASVGMWEDTNAGALSILFSLTFCGCTCKNYSMSSNELCCFRTASVIRPVEK